MRKEVPPCRAALLYYSLFIIHYSLATRAQVWNLVQFAPPISFSPCRRKRNAPRPVQRKKRGWGADEDGPVLRQDGFMLCGKRMQVWCRPACPALLFPLPLPRCARCLLLLHYSLLPLTSAKRAGEVPSAHTGQKGRAPGRGLQPIISSLFPLTSSFREARPRPWPF